MTQRNNPKFCDQCGAAVEPVDQFCSGCGRSFNIDLDETSQNYESRDLPNHSEPDTYSNISESEGNKHKYKHDRPLSDFEKLVICISILVLIFLFWKPITFWALLIWNYIF